jgi:hypothetical protein
MPSFNVTGNQLNNSALNINTNGAPAETINVFGTTEMHPTTQYGDHITVNLAAHSKWIGGFGLGPAESTMVVQGTGQFDNLSSNVNGTATIDVNVIGTGTFNLNEAHSIGKLEFMHSVSAGQTVTDSGYELYGGQFGVVQVDNPSLYHASNVLGFGEIILEGLKATSYSYKNDVLTLFKGRAVIDTLKLAVQAVGSGSPVDFGVSQVGGSVVVHADGTSYHDGGTLLAVHV